MPNLDGMSATSLIRQFDDMSEFRRDASRFVLSLFRTDRLFLFVSSSSHHLDDVQFSSGGYPIVHELGNEWSSVSFRSTRFDLQRELRPRLILVLSVFL